MEKVNIDTIKSLILRLFAIGHLNHLSFVNNKPYLKYYLVESQDEAYDIIEYLKNANIVFTEYEIEHDCLSGHIEEVDGSN